MLITTDNIEFAERLAGEKCQWQHVSNNSPAKKLNPHLFSDITFSTINSAVSNFWQHLIAVDYAPKSQFEILAKLMRGSDQLPDKLLCVARTGDNFKGYRNRKWASEAGNLHLVAFLKPDSAIRNFHTGFVIIAAISVVQTIDGIPELQGKAGIKWVNDILIEGAKVSGVLTQTQTQGNQVTGVLIGIGLNVLATPEFTKDRFVLDAVSLKEVVSENAYLNESKIFQSLIKNLQKNYQMLLNGDYAALLDFYRQRSCVIGKYVEIYSDPADGPVEKLQAGKISHIGENLELYLDDDASPVVRGRLAFQ